MMDTKTKLPAKRRIRHWSVHEKLEAIRRVSTGESKASVARDIGAPESSLRGWCKCEDKLLNVSFPCGSPESQQLDGDKSVDVHTSGPTDFKRMRMAGVSSLNQAPDDQQQQAAQFAVQSNNTCTALDDALMYSVHQEQVTLPVGRHYLETETMNLLKDANGDGSSGFSHWYKRFSSNQYPDTMDDKANVRFEVSELLNVNGYANLLACSKARSALDNVLKVNNNNKVTASTKNNNYKKVEELDYSDEEPPTIAAEAFVHGEKFLRCLECCSDPSVTASQILQFRYLLNNVHGWADCRANRIKTKN